MHLLRTLVVLALLSPAVDSVSAQEGSVPPDIEDFAHRFESAVRAFDVGAWAALVDDDVIMMAPNGRTVEGREAFRALWERSFAGQTGTNPLRITLTGARVSEDLAVVRADYGPEGDAPVGQYVWVLERSAPGWTLTWWIFNRRS